MATVSELNFNNKKEVENYSLPEVASLLKSVGLEGFATLTWTKINKIKEDAKECAKAIAAAVP